MTGKKLTAKPYTLSKWKKWKKKYPHTLVLSTDTGYRRDYSRDPYESYYQSPLAFFGFKKEVPGLPEKELVLGIEYEGIKKAYPLSLLKNLKPPLKDKILGKEITIHFDKDVEEVYGIDENDERIQGIVTYWFVWYDFHPDSAIFKK